MCDNDAESCIKCLPPSEVCTWDEATTKCQPVSGQNDHVNTFCSGLSKEKCVQDYCDSLLSAYDPVIKDGDLKFEQIFINEFATDDTERTTRLGMQTIYDASTGGNMAPVTLNASAAFDNSTIGVDLTIRKEKCATLWGADICQMVIDDSSNPDWIYIPQNDDQNLSDCTTQGDNVYYCDYHMGSNYYARLKLTTT